MLTLAGVIDMQKVIQTFVGRVVNVDFENNEFTAIMEDKTNIKNPDEEMVPSTDWISAGDKKDIEEGDLLYWKIKLNTENKITNDISLVRYSGLSRKELNKCLDIGKRIAGKINA